MAWNVLMVGLGFSDDRIWTFWLQGSEFLNARLELSNYSCWNLLIIMLEISLGQELKFLITGLRFPYGKELRTSYWQGLKFPNDKA